MLLEETESLRKIIDLRTSNLQLWHHYFGPFNYHVKYTNVLRGDNEADCTFNEDDNGYIWFVDWAKKKHYSIWDWVGAKYGIEYGEVLKKIATDFDLTTRKVDYDPLLAAIKVPNLKNPKKRNRLLDIKFNFIKPEERHFDYWSTSDYTFTEQDFKRFRILPISRFSLEFEEFSVKERIKSDTVGFCYYTGENQKQIYVPFNPKKNKFRQIITQKLIGLDELSKGNVLVTKGNKDRIINKLYYDNVTSLIAEKFKPTIEEIIDMQNCGQIYTLFDDDETGYEASMEWQQNYDSIPIFLPKGYDSYKFYKEYGLRSLKTYVMNYLN